MFVHLHVHSDNTILNGVIKVDKIVKKTKEFGMPGVALTDNSNLYSVVSFWQKCNSEGIKPIIGVELNLAPRSIKDKQPKLDEKTTCLVLLAKNFEGYKNLIKLISISHLEGFYYKPRIDLEYLEKYSDGLIALSGGIRGPIYHNFYLGNDEKAIDIALKFKDIFKGNFYIELNRLKFNEQNTIEPNLINLSKTHQIPLVATNDVFYEFPQDSEVREVLWCIDDGRTLDDPARRRAGSDQNYFKSTVEMQELFKDLPEAIENTLKIYNEIENFNISYGKVQPRYPNIPDNQTEENFLRNLVFENAPKVFGYLDDSLKDRIEHELKIIHEKGYDGYFLVVWDVVNWARRNNISVNTRGSAAGSCVAYALGISNVDPIKWNLFFERFLNPERKSFPDIDLDIAADKRDDFINYVKSTYGEDCVVNVGALGKLSTRAAIRDVGRVLGIELSLIDKLSKLVVVRFGRVVSIGAMVADELAGKDLKVIQEEKSKVEEFRNLLKEDGNNLEQIKYCDPCKKSFINIDGNFCKNCNSGLRVIAELSPRFMKLYQYVEKINNCVRNVSTHACGYLITSPTPVIEFAPLQRESGSRDRIIIQFEGKYLEDLGLMKFDFLGLDNLSIIDNSVKLIRLRKDSNFQIEKIPDNDQNAFNLLKKADTKAVFQLESAGMRKYLVQLLPDNLEEISAMLALYRPGTLPYITNYINRKFGNESVEYLIPELEPIMNVSYGIPMYQEQILQIANKLAGYSLGAADNLRRAMGKKLPEVMAQEEKKFKEGFLKNYPQYNEDIANKLWEYVIPFADYGFNKSHSAAYAVISYRSAFIKANYPTEFYASLMLSNIEDQKKLRRDILDAKEHGITFLPPDINLSDVFFAIENDNIIRFGIGGLKGVGLKTIQYIVDERRKNGKFKSLDDLCIRIDHKVVPKGALEALIKVGALDSFGPRAGLLSILDEVYERSKKFSQVQNSGGIDMFGSSTVSNDIFTKIPKIDEVSDEQKIEWENEILGVSITQGILEKLIKVAKHKNWNFFKDFVSDQNITNVKNLVLIKEVSKKRTKKSEDICFLKVEDISGTFELVLFANILETLGNNIHQNQLVYFEGTVDKLNRNKVICKKCKILSYEKVMDMLAKFFDNNKNNIGSDVTTSKNQENINNSNKPKIIELYIREDYYIDHLIQLARSFRVYEDYSQDCCSIVLIIENSNSESKRIIKLTKKYKLDILNILENENYIKYKTM